MVFHMQTAVLRETIERKVHATIPKGNMGSFQVAVPLPRHFREIWENVFVRKRHHGFGKFIFWFDLKNNWFPNTQVTNQNFACNFVLLSENFLEIAVYSKSIYRCSLSLGRCANVNCFRSQCFLIRAEDFCLKRGTASSLWKQHFME